MTLLVALLVWPAMGVSSTYLLVAVAGSVLAGGLGYRYARPVLAVLVAGCPIFALVALVVCVTRGFAG